MKKWNSLFLTAVITCIIGFTACGGGGSSDSPAAATPDPYVKFTVVGFSSSVEWIGGLSDTGLGSEPFSTLQGATTYGIGCNTTVASGSFNKETMDHVIVVVEAGVTGTYTTGSCLVQIRLLSYNGNVSFKLNNPVVIVTHYGSDYVEGTFTGTVPTLGDTVNGSFLFTNVGINKWPLP
jgi:hypothetical protein